MDIMQNAESGDEIDLRILNEDGKQLCIAGGLDFCLVDLKVYDTKTQNFYNQEVILWASQFPEETF